MATLENFYGESYELVISLSITLLLILALWSIRQIYRYNRLRTAINADIRELKRQGIAIKRIEEDLKEYGISNSEGLEHWSKIEKELTELSQLPILTEMDNEIILKLHISHTKKDYVDVTATEKSIDINISDKASPIHSSYLIPKKIDPSSLSVTYKGNTLEIRAPRIP